jgi:hypothetical protein
VATLTIKPITLAKTISGNTPQTSFFPIVSGATFSQGTPMIFGSSGSAGELTTAATGSDTSNSSAIVGISTFSSALVDQYGGTFDGTAMNSNTNQNTGVCVYLANADTVFGGSLSSSLVLSGTGCQIGLAYNLKYDSTTKYWYIDTTSTSNPTVTVTGVYDPTGGGYWGGSGDTHAYVLFQFIPAAVYSLI